MIDSPPVSPLPVPPTVQQYFALVDGPAFLITLRPDTLKRAAKLFGAEVGLITVKDILKSCAGAIYIGDESCQVPPDCCASLDYFFKRDGNNALVFRYRPFENDFALMSRGWLEARRR